MKVLGKSKKGHRILLVTDWEYELIINALFEYQVVCENDECEEHASKLKRLRNRIEKADNNIKELERLLKD